MVHTLVPMSVKIKIKNFETPARLINHMELSCAVDYIYKKGEVLDDDSLVTLKLGYENT